MERKLAVITGADGGMGTEIDEQMIYDKMKGRWESISEWFAGKDGMESEAGKVFDTTNEIIRKITRYATRISEMSNQGSNRREEYKKLADIFGKCNQAPFEVKGFRLFDKVSCKGEEGFIFGRRSSGYFDVRKLDGTRISAGISYKKLHLLEKRQSYLTEIREEEALPPLPEGRGLRA